MRNFSSAIITILLSVVLFFLFHFETIYLGPIKVSHIWKGSVLGYLLFVLIQKGKIKPYLYGPLLLLSILQLVNRELIDNPLNAITLFATTLIIPLIGMYAFKFSPKQLQNSLLYFASFFILSFVPYKIGLLSSLGSVYELVLYGSENKGLTGPFQGPHAAATTLASSLLVVVFFWLSNAYNKWLLSALFALGAYFLLLTYVRTGMAMFAMGLLPIVWFFGKQSQVKFLRLVMVLFFSTLFIFLMVISNDTMMNRITGERSWTAETGIGGSSEKESFEKLGSGRGKLYLSSIQLYAEANIAEKIIGVGQSEAMHRIGDMVGRDLIPHNGFLLLLLHNGILALLVYLSFLRNIYKLQKSMHQLDSRILIQALFLAYMTMTFFQTYDILYTLLLLMLSIAFSYKTQLIRNRIQI